MDAPAERQRERTEKGSGRGGSGESAMLFQLFRLATLRGRFGMMSTHVVAAFKMREGGPGDYLQR